MKKKLYNGKRYSVRFYCNGCCVVDKFSEYSKPGLPIENIVLISSPNDYKTMNLYAKRMEEKSNGIQF